MIGLVDRKLPWSPVVFMEDVNLSTNTHPLLAKLWCIRHFYANRIPSHTASPSDTTMAVHTNRCDIIFSFEQSFISLFL